MRRIAPFVYTGLTVNCSASLYSTGMTLAAIQQFCIANCVNVANAISRVVEGWTSMPESDYHGKLYIYVADAATPTGAANQ